MAAAPVRPRAPRLDVVRRARNADSPRFETILLGGPFNYLASAMMNVVIACAGIGVSLLVTIDPRFRTTHGYSLLALLFAVAGTASAVSSVTVGRWSDRVGRRPMILISLAGVTVTALLLASVVAWWQLYVVMTLQACWMGIFWPALEARITDSAEGSEMARRLGMFGIAVSAGLLPGPMIGGHLSDLWVRAPFYAAALLTALLLVVLVLIFRREVTRDGHCPAPPTPTHPYPSTIGPAARRAFVISAWTANGAISAAALILRGIFPRFATLPAGRGGLGLSGLAAGAIVAAIGVSMLLTFLVLGRYPFWHYRLRYLLFGQLAATLGCVLFALGTAQWLLATAALLYGIGNGVAYLSSIFYSLHQQTNRAAQSGLHEAVMRVGFVAGMLVTAVLMWHAGSHRLPYWICVVILLAGMAVQAATVLRARMHDARRDWSLDPSSLPATAPNPRAYAGAPVTAPPPSGVALEPRPQPDQVRF